jgi:hypothetical protein
MVKSTMITQRLKVLKYIEGISRANFSLVNLNHELIR